MRKKVRNLFLFFTVLAVLLPGCGGQADAGDTGADEEKNDTQTVQEDTDEYSCGFIVGSFEQVFYQKLGDAIERGSSDWDACHCHRLRAGFPGGFQ